MATPVPSEPTSLQVVIPSYLYVQYRDDEALAAFVEAFNAYAQSYLDTFNTLNLPIYTGGNITSTLLDWVAEGLYGLIRPGLPTIGIPAQGPFNSYVFNANLPLGSYIPGVDQTFIATTDDVFKRIITWAFFKGDGKQFNVRWLKRRIARFLNGINGTNYNVDQTYDISVTFTGPYSATITLAESPISTIFQSGVIAGALELPFQIAWTVTLV